MTELTRNPLQGIPLRPHLILGLLAVISSGCTTSAVESEFPVPVVDKLPLRVAVHFDESFSNYAYREQAAGEPSWVIMMGSANVSMFRRVFQGMFDQTIELPEIAPLKFPVADVDAVIVPAVETFELRVPQQPPVNPDGTPPGLEGVNLSTDYFTVWITYRMTMYDNQGREIASWPVRAYGQTPSGVMDMFGPDEALARTTTVAMRDAGAYLSIYFEDEPRIREWLREEGWLNRSRPSRRGGAMRAR